MAIVFLLDATLSNLPPAAARWLQDTLDRKENTYKILVTRYQQDREALSRDLQAVGRAVAELRIFAPDAIISDAEPLIP